MITSSSAFHRIWSGYSSKGSRFFRSVPEKNTGCWGMMVSLDRNSYRPTWWISIPSMMILPSWKANLNNDPTKDDFPAPVLPTIPI